MSDNSGSCKIIKFEPCININETLQSFADEFFEVVSVDYTDDGLEQLVGYMKIDANENQLLTMAKDKGINLPHYNTEILSSQDWLTENVISFSPVEEAEFLVYGIHEKYIDTKGKIAVQVYAATAFGSEHQTTRSCLRGISDINKKYGEQQKVLDVGTGSGVLAIACAKLWKNSQIIAVDIDDESVIVANQNAHDNNVEKQISVAYSDGYHSVIVQEHSPYDVILANILARPLIDMAPQMAQSLKKGGHAIISGFIEDQIDWVIGEHEKYGLKLIKIYKKGNWRAALLEK